MSGCLMGIVSSGRLELEKVFQKVDSLSMISFCMQLNLGGSPPSRGAFGTIAWRGCFGCLLSGDFNCISGYDEIAHQR